ncbi:MAG: insulinase family protein [Verrucomicrobia bacterium]|nr:insulinase family protein [Verrucomicrobiota bacterium]
MTVTQLKNQQKEVNSEMRSSADRFVLPNGLTVIHDEDFAHPVASLQVWVKTGSIHESIAPGSGLSHFVEHMVFKGTERRPDNQVAIDVQALGGQINAYTSFDRTVYYIDLPAEGFVQGLDILSDMLSSATMAEEDYIVERDVILREIDMGNDDPSRQLTRSVFATAFNAHPYRFPVIGHRELFETISREQLIQYYKERYVPNNMVLVVTGAVSREDLTRALEQTWAALPRRPLTPVYIPGEPIQMANRESRLTGDVQVCRGVMTFRVPGLSHPDSPVLDILATVVGGGMSSPLWMALRDQKQLVHSIEAMVWNPGEDGLFWISYTCDSGKAHTVEAAVLQELRHILAIGIEEADIQKARKQARIADLSARQTMSGLASRLGLAEAIVGDLNYPHLYLEKLGKVTVEAVANALDKYLVSANYSTCSLDKPMGGRIDKKRPPQNALPDFKELQLMNGARLLMQTDKRIPKVQVRLVGMGGPHYEFANERGLTSLASTLLTRDTLTRSAADVAKTAENAGIHFAEFTGNNVFGLAVDCMREDLPLALELLYQGCLAPALVQSSFERERAVQIARIAHDNDELFSYGIRQLRHQFFAGHPFCTIAMEILKPWQY